MALGIIDAHFMSPDKLRRWTPCCGNVASPSPSGFLTSDKKRFSQRAAQPVPKLPSAEVSSDAYALKFQPDIFLGTDLHRKVDTGGGVEKITRSCDSFTKVFLGKFRPSLD